MDCSMEIQCTDSITTNPPAIAIEEVKLALKHQRKRLVCLLSSLKPFNRTYKTVFRLKHS